MSWVEHLTPNLLLTDVVLKLVTNKPGHKNKNFRKSLCVITSLCNNVFLVPSSLISVYRFLLSKKQLFLRRSYF